MKAANLLVVDPKKLFFMKKSKIKAFVSFTFLKVPNVFALLCLKAKSRLFSDCPFSQNKREEKVEWFCF